MISYSSLESFTQTKAFDIDKVAFNIPSFLSAIPPVRFSSKSEKLFNDEKGNIP